LTLHAFGSILDFMTMQTWFNSAPLHDRLHSVGEVVESETGAVAIEGPPPALASKGRVNIDTGSAAAFVSQNSPVRRQLKVHVAGKHMVMTQTAADEFANALLVQAWRDKGAWEPESRWLDRIGQAFSSLRTI